MAPTGAATAHDATKSPLRTQQKRIPIRIIFSASY
jgi:hypothetical protein